MTKKNKGKHMQFIIRTIAAGAISIAARIIIKKIQNTNEADQTDARNTKA